MFGILRSLQGSPLIQVLALSAFVLNVTYCATHIAIDHVLLGNSLEHVEEDGENHHGQEHDHDHRQPVEESSHSVKDHMPGMVFPRDRFEVEDEFAKGGLVGLVAPQPELLPRARYTRDRPQSLEQRNPGCLQTPPGCLRGPPLFS
ncbi:MAG: hypothetical protein ACYSU1_04580 [Planctomycetota bacterium]